MNHLSLARSLLIGVTGLLAVAVTLGTDAAPPCESVSLTQRTGTTASPQATGQPFEVRFWNWLEKQDYTSNWKPFPGKSKDIYPGQAPHGAFLKMYVNEKAANAPDTVPHGSIIVKHNYAEDKETLAAITIMYRAKQDYDPEHYDWYWVKYNPDGTVARTPKDKGNKPIAGKFASCIDCHSGAAGDDYTFANDAE